eukprot:1779_1
MDTFSTDDFLNASNEAIDCKQDHITQCEAVNRIKMILNKFNTINTETNIITKMINGVFASNNYSNSCLLNDFHHMKQNHITNDDMKFAEIYAYLVNGMDKICKNKQCNHIKRHYANRSKLNNHDISFSDDVHIRYSFQLISRIHVYFIHAYDEINTINEQVNLLQHSELGDENEDMDDLLNDKRIEMETHFVKQKTKTINVRPNDHRYIEVQNTYDTIMSQDNTIDFQAIYQILIDNNISVQQKQIEAVFAEYSNDMNQFIGDIIDACYLDDRSLTLSNKILPNDHEIRHQIYENILYNYVQKNDLNNENFIKISTFVLNKMSNDIDINMFQQILANNNINGNIFLKSSSVFKNSASFAKMFKSIKGYNKKLLGSLYVHINRWIPEKTALTHNSNMIQTDHKNHTLIDVEAINKILIDNDIKIDDEQLQCAFGEYSTDKNKFIGDIIDAYYCLDDKLLVTSSKIVINNLPNDTTLRKQIYKHILFDYVKKEELNNVNFMKIATNIISSQYNDINVTEFQQIAKTKNLDGKIFVKGTNSFKNSTQFANIFKSITGYNKKLLAKIYTTIHKWKHIEIQSNKAEFNVESKYDTNVDEITNDNTETEIYEIGTRFYYWDSVKNYKHYIKSKYQCLKEEILKNKVLKFDITQWNYLYHECKTQRETHCVRKMTCNGFYQTIYKIKKSAPFSLLHLFALKLYTDYTALNQKFCATFRPKKFERIISVKNRNRKFANWARLLTECVQSYGQLRQTNKKYYRGVNQEFVFKKLITLFYVPLSTTIDFQVAVQFASGSGIVLEFKKYDDHVSCFNCSMISDFDKEREMLFLGEDSRLRINSIYQYNMKQKKWLGCKKYIDGIKEVLYLSKGTMFSNPTNNVKDILDYILSKNVSLHPYIESLLTYHLKHLPHQIEYDFEDVIRNDTYTWVKNIFLNDIKTNTPNFGTLCNLFKQCNHIIIKLPKYEYNMKQFCKLLIQDIPNITNNALQLEFVWPSEELMNKMRAELLAYCKQDDILDFLDALSVSNEMCVSIMVTKKHKKMICGITSLDNSNPQVPKMTRQDYSNDQIYVVIAYVLTNFPRHYSKFPKTLLDLILFMYDDPKVAIRSKRKYTATLSQLKEMENENIDIKWKEGTECEMLIKSENKWVNAKVMKVFSYDNRPHLKVKPSNSNIELEIPADDEFVRPTGRDERSKSTLPNTLLDKLVQVIEVINHEFKVLYQVYYTNNKLQVEKEAFLSFAEAMQYFRSVTSDQRGVSMLCNGRVLKEYGSTDYCYIANVEAQSHYNAIRGNKYNQQCMFSQFVAECIHFTNGIAKNAIKIYDALKATLKATFKFGDNELSNAEKNHSHMFVWMKKANTHLQSLDHTHFCYIVSVILYSFRLEFPLVEPNEILLCLHKIEMSGLLFSKKK